MTAIYEAYIDLDKEQRVAISRDILSIWGQFGFADVKEVDLRADVVKKLDAFALDPSAEHSGYPSFDFVKRENPFSSGDLKSDWDTVIKKWVDLFTTVIKGKTFVLQDTSSAIKTGLFVDSQTGEILDEERHQNALIMLRGVIQKRGQANMLREIKRLFLLIDESEWESFATVVKNFNGSIGTAIPNLDEEIKGLRVEAPPSKKLEALKRELEQVRKELLNATKEADKWEEELNRQRDKIADLEEERVENEELFDKIKEYVEGSAFSSDQKEIVQSTILEMIR